MKFFTTSNERRQRASMRYRVFATSWISQIVVAATRDSAVPEKQEVTGTTSRPKKNMLLDS